MCAHCFVFVESQPHSDLTNNALVNLKNIPQLPKIFGCRYYDW